MSRSSEFHLWSTLHRTRVNTWLEKHLPAKGTLSAPLAEAMRYSTLEGGKRVRALLVYAAGQVSRAHYDILDVIAASVEAIHAYSLIHDDLPAMDNDTLRRGQPTCHVQYGEAMALLAGDALQTMAFEWMSGHTIHLPPSLQLGLIHLLSRASGFDGMAGGQAIDLGAIRQTPDREALETMHAKKTGALISASVLMGASSGSALTPEIAEQLRAYARAIGLAFQVVDDVLDASENTDTLGKTAGKDALEGKPTFVSLMGIDAAREYSQQLLQEALDAIATLDDSADQLRSLATLIVSRDH